MFYYRKGRKSKVRTRRNKRSKKSYLGPKTRRTLKLMSRAVESKYIDIGINGTISTAGTFYTLGMSQAGVLLTSNYPIATGAGRDNRIGDKILIKYIELRYQLVAGGNAVGDLVSDPYNQVRVSILLSRGTRDTNSTTDVYDYTNAYGTYAGDNSRPIQTELWTPLYDTIHNITYSVNRSGSTNVGGSVFNAQVRRFIKVNRSFTYEKGNNTANKTLMLALMSDSGTAPNPAIYGYVRLHYLDV